MKFLKTLLLAGITSVTAAHTSAQSLAEVVEMDHRTESFVLRDEYRHPVETLTAFNVQADHSVLEIWPGSGWYTEILAPYLKAEGQLVVAHFPLDSEVPYFMSSRMNFEEKMSSDDVYSSVEISAMDPERGLFESSDDRFDRVLTFRNVHNWLRGGNEQTVFNEFFRVLKPGGMLGVVEHRSSDQLSRDGMISSGYMTEDYVIQVATEAGFELVERFNTNANSLDSADHEGGVWALPPTLRNGEDREDHYRAIGESDRMTLLFKKPE